MIHSNSFEFDESVGAVNHHVFMGAAGFEPAKAEPPDLQSGPFGHSGTRPGPNFSTNLAG